MCGFTKLDRDLSNRIINKKFRVLNYLGQDDDCWHFFCQGTEIKIGDEKYRPVDEGPKTISFPKRRKIGKNRTTGREEYIDLEPPIFFNKMRNRALELGQTMMQGDESPPLQDEDIF